MSIGWYGLNTCAHRTGAVGDQIIFPKGVNLISLQFRVLARGGQHDDPALGIDFDGQLHASLPIVPEQCFEHHDHIFMRVIVVVPQYDVVPRLLFRLVPAIFFLLLGLIFRRSFDGNSKLLR